MQSKYAQIMQIIKFLRPLFFNKTKLKEKINGFYYVLHQHCDIIIKWHHEDKHMTLRCKIQ